MRRQRRISESVINRAINNSMRRMVNEGTTDSDVIDKWQEVKDSLGASKMIDDLFEYLSEDQIVKILGWFNEDYQLFDDDEE
mgnify:CR=1 FL=1|jgi:hypothetical protein